MHPTSGPYFFLVNFLLSFFGSKVLIIMFWTFGRVLCPWIWVIHYPLSNLLALYVTAWSIACYIARAGSLLSYSSVWFIIISVVNIIFLNIIIIIFIRFVVVVNRGRLSPLCQIIMLNLELLLVVMNTSLYIYLFICFCY